MQHWRDSDPPPFEILIRHTADAVAELYCCNVFVLNMQLYLYLYLHLHLFNFRERPPSFLKYKLTTQG